MNGVRIVRVVFNLSGRFLSSQTLSGSTKSFWMLPHFHAKADNMQNDQDDHMDSSVLSTTLLISFRFTSCDMFQRPHL